MKKIILFASGVLIAVCMLLSFNFFVEEPSQATAPAGKEIFRWKVDTLSQGVVLKTVHFTKNDLFGANQFICVIEILPGSKARLAFAHRPSLTPTSTIARESNALAAVNGTFFDMVRGNSICYLRIGGKQLGENAPQKPETNNRKYYQYATMVLNSNGRPELYVPDSNRHWEESHFDSTVTDAMTAGPMLLTDGKAVPQRKDRTFATHRHNRTALGIRPDGTVILFTVDGRTKQSAGMTLDELAKTMLMLGCTNAMNLDGGGSTTMYVRGRANGGIVNYPSDNKRFDHQGERSVSNILMVMDN